MPITHIMATMVTTTVIVLTTTLVTAVISLVSGHRWVTAMM
jgi:hypothetical protein